MLEKYKEIYKNAASIIPNWENENKNTLINKYVEFKDSNPILADSYAAAIIYRYWNLISKYYYKSNRSVIKDDCVEWLMDAFIYATSHKKWLDKDNKLSQDKNGPDKVLNQCMDSERRIFYQAANYDVRKINYNTTSIQELEENNQDYIIPYSPQFKEDDECIWINSYIKKLFKDHNYIDALILHAISYADVFNSQKTKDINITTTFNDRKLSKYLRSLGNEDYNQLIEKYDISSLDIDKIKSVSSNFTSVKVKKIINNSLVSLKNKLDNCLF